MKWIDAVALEADIAKFLPVVTGIASLIPGSVGNSIVAFLTAIASEKVIGPVVDLINDLTGAKPPA